MTMQSVSVWLPATALVTLMLAPLAAAVLLLAGRWSSRQATGVALGISVVQVAVLVVAGAPVVRRDGSVHLDALWIASWGAHAHLVLDGLALPMVVLTVLLGLMVAVYLRHESVAGSAGLVAALLLVQAGSIGVFLAADLLVFFVCFELVLLPMWVVIARWGSVDPWRIPGQSVLRPPVTRRGAAAGFLVYTLVGSALVLAAVVVVAIRTGSTDLQVIAAGSGLDHGTQVAVAVLLVAGLAVKVPLWPVHTWLAPAHTMAPTVGSVLLAGVLLKLGSYAMVRFAVPLAPQGMTVVAPVLAVLGVVGLWWAAWLCFAQGDAKSVVAISSIAHMGVVTVGIATLTPLGVQGAMLLSVGHGVASACWFFVVGMLKTRVGSGALSTLGSGWRTLAPRLGTALLLSGCAAMGLPGLAGWWGEVMILRAAWNAPVWGSAGPWFAAAVAVGLIPVLAYVWRFLRLLWHDPAPSSPGTDPLVPGAVSEPVVDAAPAETFVLVVLSAVVVLLGVAPQLVANLTGPVVRALVRIGSGGG